MWLKESSMRLGPMQRQRKQRRMQGATRCEITEPLMDHILCIGPRRLLFVGLFFFRVFLMLF